MSINDDVIRFMTIRVEEHVADQSVMMRTGRGRDRDVRGPRDRDSRPPRRDDDRPRRDDSAPKAEEKAPAAEAAATEEKS